MWSGGLDSTAVFYALKNTGKQFKVLFNSNSVDEFPELGKDILDGKYNNATSFYQDSSTFNLLDYVIDNPGEKFITGEIGDQTFGSAISYNLPYEVRQQHYSKVIPIEGADILSPAITTVAEYYWACNFLFKYQNVQVRMAYQYQIAPVEPFNNAIHFFDTPEFNLWSMQNYEENALYPSLVSYKGKMKDYLKENQCYTKYVDTKIKIGSLVNALYDAGRPKTNRQQIIG
mgnify:CR=1 FL=1